jgi:hypothetical protein
VLPILTTVSAPTTSPPSRGVAVPAAVGVVVAAVVAMLALVGLVVSLTDDPLPTGPALPPPEATAPEVSFEPSTRSARYDNSFVTMPAAPYACPADPASRPPLLSSAIVCSAAVHADYQGSADWAATAGFGPVSEDLTRSTAEATAQAFFEAFRSGGFGDHPTSLADYQTQQVTLSGQPVTAVSGNIRYEIAGLSSSYDRLLVIAVPVQHGGYVVYFSSRPDDTPESVLESLNASINTLRIE